MSTLDYKMTITDYDTEKGWALMRYCIENKLDVRVANSILHVKTTSEKVASLKDRFLWLGQAVEYKPEYYETVQLQLVEDE